VWTRSNQVDILHRIVHEDFEELYTKDGETKGVNGRGILERRVHSLHYRVSIKV
jgi:hypothetical protein